jgi:hypothetical protein
MTSQINRTRAWTQARITGEKALKRNDDQRAQQPQHSFFIHFWKQVRVKTPQAAYGHH